MQTMMSLQPAHRGSYVLVALLAWGCHSNGASRDAASDAAQADVARIADAVGVADMPVGADTGAFDGQRDAPGEAADAPVGDDGAALDVRPDAASGAEGTLDGGIELPAAGGMADGGLDGAGVFQCKFPIANPKTLYCDNGQYCVAMAGGPVGSGTTYSCAAAQAACASNTTCECICGQGGVSNCSIPAYPTIHCTCISNPDGLTLLCAAP